MQKKRTFIVTEATEISKLDENKNSPVCQLHDHIERGFSIGRQEAVVEALVRAEEVVNKNYRKLNNDIREHLQATLRTVVNAVADEQLNVNRDVVFNQGNQSQRASTIKVCRPTKFLKKVKFEEDVKFEDDVKFEKHAKFEHSVKFDGHVKFGNDVIFEDSVIVEDSITIASGTVNGTFSVADLVAGELDTLCDITVGCNINMNDSINPSIGNIIKNGASFIHNFGSDNTFVGSNAGNFSTTGSDNSAFGFNAMNSNTSGSSNTACGSFALLDNTQGVSNTAIGSSCLSNNTTGSGNTALGQVALISNTTGSGNTAGGVGALAANTTGSNNTAFGFDTLSANITGSGNIALGTNAGNAHVAGNNNIYIGNAGINTESGIIRIGTVTTHTQSYMQGIFGKTTALGGLAVEVDITGKLGTQVSSSQFKRNINDMDMESANIHRLRPVIFSYNDDATNTIQYGLIAEEVADIFPSLVVNDKDGNPYSVRYQVLPVLLLNEVQRQQASIEALAERVERLENAPAA